MVEETKTLCVRCTPGDQKACRAILAEWAKKTGLSRGKVLTSILRAARMPEPSTRQHRTEKARAVKAAKRAAKELARESALDLPTVLRRVTELTSTPDLPSDS